MTEDVRYIFSSGDLIRRDSSICFKNENGNIHMPIEKIRELYCFDEQTITTKLLDICGRSGIIIHFSIIMIIMLARFIQKRI